MSIKSIKQKIRTLAIERETAFSQLWQNLILERFLVRLSLSPYRDIFVLKGGTLLSKYLPLGRETRDLDFDIHQLSNTTKTLQKVFLDICRIDLEDRFSLEIKKIEFLNHVHNPYQGAQITLLAKFGNTKTPMRIDLGFGDSVAVIDHPIELIATSKGPLFEKFITLKCYPIEFIFAEKLETVVFRGELNTRMKDFHDLYSLISFGNLEIKDAEKAVEFVFNLRKTSLQNLPIYFDQNAFIQLEKRWQSYQKKRTSKSLPDSLEKLIQKINNWLLKNTYLCTTKQIFK